MTTRFRIRLALTASLILGTSLTGCIGQPSESAPVVPIRNMYVQPRANPQARSVFFADHRTMRPPVEGAVAQEMEPEISVQTGRSNDDAAWLAEIPPSVVERNGGIAAMAQRGRGRYDIYCAPCHAAAGNGQGMIYRRAEQLAAIGRSNGFAPTNLHDERIRHIPDGQLYATVTNGVRTMPAYRQSIPLDDRWNIVAYVRALQLSQAGRTTASNTEQNQ